MVFPTLQSAQIKKAAFFQSLLFLIVLVGLFFLKRDWLAFIFGFLLGFYYISLLFLSARWFKVPLLFWGITFLKWLGLGFFLFFFLKSSLNLEFILGVSLWLCFWLIFALEFRKTG